jgi:tetratricopeptide (TPR) repeat protein
LKKLLLSILTLLIMFSSAGCGNQISTVENPEAVQLNKDGLLLIKNGMYDEAIEKLKAAVDLSPENKTYITNLAFALYHTNQFDDAIINFQRSLELDPEDHLIYLDYGTCLHQSGRTEDAIPIFEEGARLSRETKDFPKILTELAKCYESTGDKDKAIETLRRLIDASPRAEYYSKLGDLLQEKGDLEGAETEYRNAVNLSPNYAPALNNLGLLLCDQGKKAEGMKLYHYVLDKDPRNPVAHNNLAMEQWEKGYIDSAIEEIKAAIASDPNNALYHFHYAMILNDAGRTDEAISELEAAIALEPEFTDAVTKLNELKG